MPFPKPLSYFGLIGDIHAEDELLETALAYLNKNNVPDVLCTGDIADGRGSVSRCCELLRKHSVQTVRGNHDRWLLAGAMRNLPNATDPKALSAEALEYLSTLPPTREFASPLGGLLLCHGLGSNDMARLGPNDFGYELDANEELKALQRNPAFSVVVNGHSHQAMVRQFTDLTVINAGTLLPHDSSGFVLVDLPGRQVQMLHFGAQSEVYVARTLPV